MEITLTTETMKLEDITPADYNPRKPLKPGDKEYEALKASLDHFGLVEPLVFNTRTKTLVGGHQRLNVLTALGETEAEVVLVDVDRDKEKLLNLALNKIEGDWDYSKLEILFKEIDEDDIQFTGFSKDELNDLFGEALSGGSNYTYEDDSDEEEETAPSTKEKEEKPQKPSEFNIFLSFPNKELAEEWLAQEGVEVEFAGTSRNITIRMEGTDYGN